MLTIARVLQLVCPLHGIECASTVFVESHVPIIVVRRQPQLRQFSSSPLSISLAYVAGNVALAREPHTGAWDHELPLSHPPAHPLVISLTFTATH
jgi:hypothetical protein